MSESRQAPQDATAPPAAAASVQVLLVEDTPEHAALIGHMLETLPDADYELHVAGNLADATTALRERPFDVVVTDLNLPDGNGLDSFRRIYAAAPHIPIVVMSSLADERLADRAVRIGAQDYIVKGQVTPPGLGRSLRHAIERKQFQEEIIVARDEAEYANRELARVNGNLELSNQRLREMTIKAQEAAAFKSAFLANMSHEIRTPLNGIIGMCNMLIATDLEPDQARLADTLNNLSQNLLVLVNDILDFSKIEAGKLQLDCVGFSIHKLVQSAVSAFQPAAQSKGLDIQAVCQPSLPESLLGDPTRLRQVIDNLLGNAIKFTSQGSVRLTARPEAIDETGVAMRIAVEDTGIGIAPEKIRLIFDAFQQEDSATHRQYGGTGLGLAISAQLVDLMGGNLDVRSEPGKGSEFFFTVHLPLADHTLQLPATTPSLGAIGQMPQHLRVLLVEDNLVNQEVGAYTVGTFGYDVEVCANGRQALEALDTQHFDLLLLDIQMPEMDGMETIRLLRAREKERGLPRLAVIAMTAWSMSEDRDRCLEAGMDDFVPKPISREALAAAILRVLGLADSPEPHSQQPACPAAPPDTPVDAADFKHRLQNNPRVCARVLDAFRQDADNRLRQVREAMRDKDNEALRLSAHALQGAAANISAQALRDSAQALEMLGADGDQAARTSAMKDLETEFERLMRFLNDSARLDRAGLPKGDGTP